MITLRCPVTTNLTEFCSIVAILSYKFSQISGVTTPPYPLESPVDFLGCLLQTA